MGEPVTFGRRLMAVLWPAFLVAAVANALFFTAFDPQDLTFFGQPVEAARELMYTIGFFAFWAVAAAAAGLAVAMARR